MKYDTTQIENTLGQIAQSLQAIENLFGKLVEFSAPQFHESTIEFEPLELKDIKNYGEQS